MEEKKTAVVLSTPAQDKILAITERYKSVTLIETPADYSLVVAGIRECREFRTDIEKDRKAAVREPLDFISATNTEAKRITSEISAIEAPLKYLRDGEDAKKEAIREEKRLAEVQRVADIQLKIASLQPVLPPASTVSEYDAAISALEHRPISADDYAEYIDSASCAKTEGLTLLRAARVLREKFEAEQLRQAEEADRLEIETAKLAKKKEENEAADKERKRIADEEAAVSKKKIDEAKAAHALKVKAEEDRLQEVEDSRQRALADERVELEAEKERLRLVQQAIDDKEAAAVAEAARAARDRVAKFEAEALEAAEKLEKEKEAKEAAERAERLKPDNEKLLSVVGDIEKIIDDFPKVSEPEALELKREITTRLVRVHEFITCSLENIPVK